MTPRSFKCTPCRRAFATARGAYLHWLKAHSTEKLGSGERAVLQDIQEARDLPKRGQSERDT